MQFWLRAPRLREEVYEKQPAPRDAECTRLESLRKADFSLEIELQSKLNDSSITRRENLPESGAVAGNIRRSEIGAIESIEELGAELKANPLSTLKFFASVKSKFTYPGPRMIPTPALPKACGAGLNAGWKASILNQRAPCAAIQARPGCRSGSAAPAVRRRY